MVAVVPNGRVGVRDSDARRPTAPEGIAFSPRLPSTVLGPGSAPGVLATSRVELVGVLEARQDPIVSVSNGRLPRLGVCFFPFPTMAPEATKMSPVCACRPRV